MSTSPRTISPDHPSLLLVQLCAHHPTNHPGCLVFTGAALHSVGASYFDSLSEFLCRQIPRLTMSALLFRLHTSGQTRVLTCLFGQLSNQDHLPRAARGLGGGWLRQHFTKCFWPSLRAESGGHHVLNEHQPRSRPSSGSWQDFQLSIMQSLNSSTHKITSSWVHSKPVRRAICLYNITQAASKV